MPFCVAIALQYTREKACQANNFFTALKKNTNIRHKLLKQHLSRKKMLAKRNLVQALTITQTQMSRVRWSCAEKFLFWVLRLRYSSQKGWERFTGQSEICTVTCSTPVWAIGHFGMEFLYKSTQILLHRKTNQWADINPSLMLAVSLHPLQHSQYPVLFSTCMCPRTVLNVKHA